MKTFCIGDIHGNYKGLVQVLERASFDYDNDLLITLGDIVDGLPQSYECVEELLKIRHRIDIRGNHDDFFYQWLVNGNHPCMWAQGGIYTAESYAKGHDIDLHVHKTYERDAFNKPQPKYIINLLSVVINDRHRDFFRKQVSFYVDDENRGFVHAGYLHPEGLGHDDPYTYMWSRKLWQDHAMIPSQNPPKLLKPHKHLFIGHTQTLNWNTTDPMTRYNVTNLDTGAGWLKGKLTIMNVDTREYWQSDSNDILYPEYNPYK